MQARPTAANFALPGLTNSLFYLITGPLTVSRRGQIVRGQNMWYTHIKQVTPAASGFLVKLDNANDTPQGNTQNQTVTFEHLRITGLGQATSTGIGIDIQDDGDWFVTRNVDVWGFGTGIHDHSWAQILFESSVFHYNSINIDLDSTGSACNTITFLNTGVTGASVMNLRAGNGCASTIVGGDWRASPLTHRPGGQSNPTDTGRRKLRGGHRSGNRVHPRWHGVQVDHHGFLVPEGRRGRRKAASG